MALRARTKEQENKELHAIPEHDRKKKYGKENVKAYNQEASKVERKIDSGLAPCLFQYKAFVFALSFIYVVIVGFYAMPKQRAPVWSIPDPNKRMQGVEKKHSPPHPVKKDRSDPLVDKKKK